MKSDEHALLRSAFERALERDPLQPYGWACLAGLYHQEHGVGLNPLPDIGTRLRRAAQRAIELDATCQDGWKELAIAYFFFDRDLTALRTAAERTLSLNPLDTGAVAWVGGMLAYAGDWERGVDVVRQALATNPHHPGWYHLVLSADHYRRHDYEEALKSAKQIHMSAFFPSHLYLAAAAGQLGRRDEARVHLRNLERIGAPFLDPLRAREYWAAWIWDEQVVEHLVEGFVKAKALADHQPAPAAHVASIAVLPFTDMNADKENEYFGDGLAEEIINVLAQVAGLKVACRTSSFYFRGKDVEFEEIGRRLHVEHILEGSVRKAGDRIRVTAQLVKVADGFHLWSERYDREMTDIFALQDEITHAIAAALRITLSPPATLPRHEPNLRAYEAYLRARHLCFQATPESLALVKGPLDQAIEIDPAFAQAYSLLGLHYSLLAAQGVRPAREVIPLARAAAQEALRVDPSLSEAHALLGVWAGNYDYDWHAAERHWRLAIDRQPMSHIRFWYGNHYLLPIGRWHEAVETMAAALREDPLNLLCRHHLARGLQHAGRLELAEAELRKVLEIDGTFALALGTLGAICAQQGRFEEALELTERAHALKPWANQIAGQLAALLARAGATSRADALVEKLGSGDAYGAPTGLAVFHALCGDFDRAAQWAERASQERYPPLVHILRPLFASDRWRAVAKLLNLPA